MILLIVFLVVWVIGTIAWNYRIYNKDGFLCPNAIFQGLFAGVPNLVIIFSEWLESKLDWWTTPILMSKALKDDIEFLTKEYPPVMVIHEKDGSETHFTAEQIDKLGKKLIEEVKKQAIIESKKKSTKKGKKK